MWTEVESNKDENLKPSAPVRFHVFARDFVIICQKEARIKCKSNMGNSRFVMSATMTLNSSAVFLEQAVLSAFAGVVTVSTPSTPSLLRDSTNGFYRLHLYQVLIYSCALGCSPPVDIISAC